MKPIIRIENLGKSYRIGGLHPGYVTFREMIAGAVVAPFKRLGGAGGRARETLWALKGINLEVEEGELIGVVGRNGAGKSTLLKILSRITKPTTGRAAIRGRVGSLLEVGTGFHPDLTGRENIFLNGAILGMRRFEIAAKFDEIVAFSEIEKFIETPVKFYSSGMYVRLAFSVAAHLEPEILMMDEVLAVGDAAFQQKCLDKMHDIRQQGRTIFFVSHNMPAVTRLCKRVVLLEGGQIVSDGAAQKVVNDYLSASWSVGAERVWDDASEAPGNEIVRLRRARVRTREGETIAVVDIRHSFGIEITYEVREVGHVLLPVVDLSNEEGVHLFSAHDTGADWRRRPRPAGIYTSTVWIPGNLLAEGNLLVHVSMMSHEPATVLHARERNAVAFQIVDAGVEAGEAARGDLVGPIPGVVRPLLPWTTEVRTSEETKHTTP
jgi:lipopolysaccharide transport system ATP-binding protein